MASEKVVISDKSIFALSICVLVYLIFLLLNSQLFKLDLVIIGVIQEIITLPIIIVQLLLLILAFMSFKKSNYAFKSYAFWAMVVLTMTNVFVIGSFALR